ncbi:siderophore biosynthesis protein [Azoarcus sp. PA01]|nr:siderophore biosynthesis protein [Azoarcus sp. PA01]
MPNMPSHSYERRLLQDLFDALWLEDLYGFRSQCRFHAAVEGEAVVEVELSPGRVLRWHGRQAGGVRPFRVSERGVASPGASQSARLAPVEVAETLQTADWWKESTGRFARFFSLASDQAKLAATHEPGILAKLAAAPDDLLSWETLSCLKDRPFHPLARAKDWGDSDGSAYAAEAAAPIPLQWVAVRRDQVRGSTDAVGQPVAEALLDPAQHERLAAAARARGAEGDAWLWMPVHPWQWAHLERRASPPLAQCIDLGTGPGTAIPTASLRSLAVVGRPATHLKLALSVNALGAVRTLPPRYLHNATLARACLENLRERDEWLASHLLLCDENHWWALRQCDALETEPGELACLVRRYPSLPDARLIPMAALPVVTADGALPAFDLLLGPLAEEDDAWALFADVVGALLELGLRCLAYGVMPELHGQNVLLAFRGWRIAALVLRDHDTLRICPPLMNAQGAAVPDYVVDRRTPNTLELATPRELLAYLQTLAIEVNLYAVIAALSDRYGRDEARGWRILGGVLEACLARVPLPAAIAASTRSLLLDEPGWPFKQVLAPLLGRASFGTGMPSAMGRIDNPLLPARS